LTSCNQVESAALCRNMGVETYLIKPISSSDLLGSIRLAIGVHRPTSTVTLPAAGIIAKDLAGRRQLGESKSRPGYAGQDGTPDHAGKEWPGSAGAMETK